MRSNSKCLFCTKEQNEASNFSGSQESEIYLQMQNLDFRLSKNCLSNPEISAMNELFHCQCILYRVRRMLCDPDPWVGAHKVGRLADVRSRYLENA